MEDSSRRYEPLDIKEGVEPPYRLIDRDSTFKQSNGALNIRRVGAGRRAHLSDWFHTVINQATYDMKRITLRVLAPCFDISFIVTCGNDVLWLQVENYRGCNSIILHDLLDLFDRLLLGIRRL
jgi:hypothetical protein